MQKIGVPTLSRLRDKFWSLLFVSGLFLSCTHQPPLAEYTLARTAIQSAKRIEAVRYAPGYFHKAEELYLKGEKEFRKDQYSYAEESFSKARFFAEKSENTARLRRFKTGEEFP
jgi:hypothetical protein